MGLLEFRFRSIIVICNFTHLSARWGVLVCNVILNSVICVINNGGPWTGLPNGNGGLTIGLFLIVGAIILGFCGGIFLTRGLGMFFYYTFYFLKVTIWGIT